MNGAIEPVLTTLLPLTVGAGATMIGIAAMVGSCRFQLSTERSVLIALLALFVLFAVFYLCVGPQISVMVVLGVVGLGFSAALILKRICVESKRHMPEGT